MSRAASIILLSSGVPALLGLRCATPTPPSELVDARAEYDKASHGPAVEVNPKGLYEAKKSLDSANTAFTNEPTAPETRDLAYVALRKTQIAEAQTNIELANRQKVKAEKDIQQTTATQLSEVKQQLSEVEKARQKAEQDFAAERKKAEEAAEALAKIGTVKNEDRGTVLTLSGSVLFASGQSALLANARSKLDEVATALKQAEGSQFVVEGHTDSVGSDSFNQDLSVRRAQSVRDYLVDRGVPADKIKAVGFGKTRPVTDNSTAEGRANNRRVELVIQKHENS